MSSSDGGIFVFSEIHFPPAIVSIILGIFTDDPTIAVEGDFELSVGLQTIEFGFDVWISFEVCSTTTAELVFESDFFELNPEGPGLLISMVSISSEVEEPFEEVKANICGNSDDKKEDEYVLGLNRVMIVF